MRLILPSFSTHPRKGPVLRATFSNIRVSCIYLSLAVRFNHVLIIGSFKHKVFFVQQYSLTVQNGTVPLLPLSDCVLPDRGQARWREVGWSSECHRTARWWGKEWILLCLWRSRCMYASLWSDFNPVRHIWMWALMIHAIWIIHCLKQVIFICSQPLKCVCVLLRVSDGTTAPCLVQRRSLCSRCVKSVATWWGPARPTTPNTPCLYGKMYSHAQLHIEWGKWMHPC